MSLLAFLAVGLGFCLIIEGLAYVLFPRQFQAMWEMIRQVSPDKLRTAGVFACAAGVAIVWLVMG